MHARGFQWVSQLPWKNKVKCFYRCILNRTCNLNGYFLFSCSFVLLCLEIVEKSNLGKAWQMQPRGFQWSVAISKRRKTKISHFSSDLQVVIQSCIFESPKCNQEDFKGGVWYVSKNATNEDAGKRISMGVTVALKKQGKMFFLLFFNLLTTNMQGH